MRTAIVLFNRDLRTHDNPALAAAASAGALLPLFVLDPALLRGFGCPNRLRFMLESLADLDRSLRAAGSALVVREGDPVAETIRVAAGCGAGEVHVGADWSRYARGREGGLAAACERSRLAFHRHPGVTVVPPGEVLPARGGGDDRGRAPHFRVFTPYFRAWRESPWRCAAPRPRRLPPLPEVGSAALPDPLRLAPGASPGLAAGGESEGRRRLAAFLRSIGDYGESRDDLAADATSNLSAHLRFGCLSPLEVARRSLRREGGEAFARQLCWRDFHHQVLAAFPDYPRRDYRPRGDRWSRSVRALQAWKEGRTGYPIVDAGMRQLALEGRMHNRARMIVASFLCKDLYIDWRRGAEHFWGLLADGEIANNAGNWQWVAGTGNDTRPNRVLSPLRQAHRFDPRGDYVRRYVEELSSIDGPAVHEPWRLGPLQRGALGYPEPIVDHAEAVAAFRAARGSA
ncbi:MAG: deoxyribodipyrimidine photo-lyase [Solirubrobacterales bacterium]